MVRQLRQGDEEDAGVKMMAKIKEVLIAAAVDGEGRMHGAGMQLQSPEEEVRPHSPDSVSLAHAFLKMIQRCTSGFQPLNSVPW